MLGMCWRSSYIDLPVGYVNDYELDAYRSNGGTVTVGWPLTSRAHGRLDWLPSVWNFDIVNLGNDFHPTAF